MTLDSDQGRRWATPIEYFSIVKRSLGLQVNLFFAVMFALLALYIFGLYTIFIFSLLYGLTGFVSVSNFVTLRDQNVELTWKKYTNLDWKRQAERGQLKVYYPPLTSSQFALFSVGGVICILLIFVEVISS